jgi:Rnl2 family RNA ligase
MSQLVHLPYPKLPAAGGASAPAWVALEKIHGANFVIGVSAAEERFGKRKEWLADGDAFFGWQLLRAELRAVARRVFDRLGDPGDVIYLYGELFGGAYPHPDVAAAPGVSAVQTGVWYAPALHWSPFDIRVVRGEGEDVFLSFTETADIARAEGLLTPPVVARGPRTEVERAPVRYPSRVAARLGLPDIAGNTAEGLVKKPDVRMSVPMLTVFKEKIPEMNEKAFDDSGPFDETQILSRDAVALWAARLVNRARIDSAASKVGGEPDAIVTEVILDVLIDLNDALPASVASLGDAGEAAIAAVISRATRTLL